ncbi:hypothetical protein FLONG3_11415 [Fusarium longipes]|uniref:Uncharacterized protein n=1 Tax=Fusarium longipes TaxID=694270 RepID=A0A395RFR8_9HYPO|nr:hypothetical protein FLONG3_11415 [Fusarium longipes]
MSRSIILSVLLLSTTVLASNVLFGAYSTEKCDSCLDQTFESCPGDYKTRSYATCMCAGDGSTNFVSCLSYCDPTLNEPANASATYYGYCLIFFKELCDGAQQFVSEETYARQCSKEAIEAGGRGEKGGDDSGEDEDGGSNKKDTNTDTDSEKRQVTWIRKISKPTKTNQPASSKTDETSEVNDTNAATTTNDASKTSETAQTTSGAKATAIPAMALFVGLGLQFVNA